MKTGKKRLKGFTLVEMIVVVALFMMMMACVFSVLGPMNRVFDDTAKYADAQAVADNVARYIEDEVRYSNRLHLYDKVSVDEANESIFVKDCVKDFREAYVFGQTGKTRLSGSDTEDLVYVLKIDNPADENDLESRGQISRWTYKNGSEVTSEYKEWAVPEAMYDYAAKNIYYSFMFTMGTWEDTAGVFDVSPTNFSMDMSVYKTKRNSTKLEDSYLDQTVAFALVNLAANDAIKKETIKYVDDVHGDAEREESRYKYNLVDTGSDVYFVYTKVPKIEDIT